MGAFVPESSSRRTGRVPSDRARRDDEQTGERDAVLWLSRSKQRDMRPFHRCAHRSRVVETEQAVRIVDQHVEVLEEILAQNAPNVQIGGMEILEVINEHLLPGNSVGAGFDQVELCEGSRLKRSGACGHCDRARLSIQMKFRGERGIDHRDLGAAIQ